MGGCTISDCTEKYGNEFLANRQSADFTPYGGENFTMLMHRIGEFLTEVSKAHVGNVAVFTHGCTIGAVLSYVLHMTTLAPIALPGNGSICIIEFTEGQWRVVSWNIPPL
ncbi:MAG: histidine phosphatase family protein [Ruminococcaceae bacterium]|nr:histidine phosphatase family protein [Oscillospiraceae bacterium]